MTLNILSLLSVLLAGNDAGGRELEHDDDIYECIQIV